MMFPRYSWICSDPSGRVLHVSDSERECRYWMNASGPMDAPVLYVSRHKHNPRRVVGSSLHFGV